MTYSYSNTPYIRSFLSEIKLVLFIDICNRFTHTFQPPESGKYTFSWCRGRVCGGKCVTYATHACLTSSGQWFSVHIMLNNLFSVMLYLGSIFPGA